MLIGELSKKSGFSRDAIRFYEKNGLIQTHSNLRRENNYKDYSENVLNRLLLIKQIKSFGFTLREIAEILHLLDTESPTCGSVLLVVDEKIIQIEQKITQLEKFKLLLLKKVAECRNECPETENCTAFG